MSEKMEFDPEIIEAIETISKDKPKQFDDCIEVDKYNKKDWEALHKCNMIIDGRVRYGLRTEEASKGTFMSWSNATKRWFAGQPIEPGVKIRPLDANEMICPMSHERAKRIACYLKNLPLYYASTEAKMRGEVSQKEALDIFAEGKGIHEMLESVSPEKREQIKKDIKEKGWGWFFSERKRE